MTALEYIEKLYEMDAELCDTAGKEVAFDTDENFLQTLSLWAAKMSGEDANAALVSLKEKYDADAIAALKDILSASRSDCHFGTREQYEEWKKTTTRVTIHRGAKQIGGSIAEIAMGKTHLWIDCGSELPGSIGGASDGDIVKTLEAAPPNAVLFTHYHGDHIGLMEKIPSHIPLYMDEVMLQILQTLHQHTGNSVLREILANRDGCIHAFKPGETLSIGDIKVTPLFTDHSAYRAAMFFMENKLTGRTILHSGDFRSGGYLSKTLEKIPFIIHSKLRKEVDVLITEGTMLTRNIKAERLMSEWDLRRETVDFMREHREVFVICSSTNFDTLTSICHGAYANNIPVYADTYQQKMLAKFSEVAGAKTSLYRIPKINDIGEIWKNQAKGYVLLLGTLMNKPTEKTASLYDNYLKGMRKKAPWLIYSMWKGYLNSKHSAFNANLAAFVDKFGERVNYAHSAGHADRKTLARFIKAINPRKMIIPMHTENAAGFMELDIEEKYKNMIVLPEDGDTVDNL